MKTLLIVVAVIIIALIFKAFIPGNRRGKNPSRPPENKKPTSEKENDKIILIENANAEDVKKALIAFCNLYNKNDFAAMPRLWELSPTSFAVTFPYDVDFSIYCFAVNYLEYPIDIEWHANVRGWATTRMGDDWILQENAGKKVMIFIAPDDTEHDNVFMTTNENKTYKLAFSASKPKAFDILNEIYKKPSITPNELITQKHQDFQ